MLKKRYLDHQLECPSCGTIRLEIPHDAGEADTVACSSCGRELGAWGELQDDLDRQLGEGVFEVDGGRFRRK